MTIENNAAPVHITAEDASDPAKLAQALADATAAKSALIVDPAPGGTTLDLQDRTMHISKEDASDPAKYRRAKAMAAEAGQTLIIDPAAPPAPRKYELGTVLIPKGASTAEYRRLRDDAIKRGVPYAVREA